MPSCPQDQVLLHEEAEVRQVKAHRAVPGTASEPKPGPSSQSPRLPTQTAAQPLSLGTCDVQGRQGQGRAAGCAAQREALPAPQGLVHASPGRKEETELAGHRREAEEAPVPR